MNIIGDTYGQLTVITLVSSINYRKKYLCKCSCGNTCEVAMSHLRTGHTKSCGCFQQQNPPRKSHGDARSKLYRRYQQMIRRCHVPTDTCYPKYGLQGITVCTSWLNSYTEFKEWAISNNYTDELTLDRIDVLKGYCPENCRWVGYTTQAINKKPRSKTPYVYFYKTKLKWIAHIRSKGKPMIDETYTTQEDAMKAIVSFVKANSLTEHLRVLSRADGYTNYLS